MTDQPFTLEIPDVPNRADREIILNRLIEFEGAAAGPPDIKPLSILVKGASGETLGGLWGNTVFRWLVVELVFIPETARGRGLGLEIMTRAEAIARDRGCIGIWLDTYSFQARGFYEKLGFNVFGQIDDHPPGEQRFFMKKILTAVA